MRFFEVTVVLLSAVLVMNMSITKSRRKGTSSLLLMVILITLLHLLIEGYRWQMVPSYLLLGLFTLIRNRESQKTATVVISIIWTFSLLLPATVPVVKLPKPTGPFKVGTAIFHWTDTTRTEWFTEEPGDLRKMMIQLWYPAKINSRNKASPYIDHIDLRAQAIGDRVGLPSFMLDHLNLVKTHSFIEASPIESKELFPLIIFSHGLGGMRNQNTVLMEELASTGYAVVAMDHPYDANMTIFPPNSEASAERIADYRSAIPEGTADSIWLKIRNRQLDTRIADVLFILQQLETVDTPLLSRINFQQIGIAGHSFGGATAVLSAMQDHRFKAAVALDGWFVPFAIPDAEAKMDVPFLYLGQMSWKSWNEQRHRHYLDLIMSQSGENAYHLSIRGSKHYDYADMPLFSPIMQILGLVGFPDGRKMVKIVNQSTLQFFNQFVRGNTTIDFSNLRFSSSIQIRRGLATSS